MWNVQTLGKNSSCQITRHVLKEYKYNVIGLCQVRWTNYGKEHGGAMNQTGGETHETGIEMILSERLRKVFKGYRQVNERSVYANFRINLRDITFTVAFAPNTDYSEEELGYLTIL